MLPLSPPLPRVPISTNARYSMPMLATAPQFDSALVGTSTSRLLRPVELDRVLGGHFVNLAMNAATAWEQAQMVALFARTHAVPRRVLVGLDLSWCALAPEQSSGRSFPSWMYDGSRWAGYLHMLNLYAVQEASSQLWVMLGFKRRRYGLDGYTSFVPPDESYDPARVAATFARPDLLSSVPTPNPAERFPALMLLAQALRNLPASTRKLLFFTPSSIVLQGAPGSDVARAWAACKAQVARLAAEVPNTVVADFLVPSAITSDRSNYWDPLHFRTGVADRIVAGLARAEAGEDVPDGQVLLRPDFQR